MQAMIQAMQIQYAEVAHHVRQEYGGFGYHDGHTNYCGRGGHVAQCRVNWQCGQSSQGSSDLTH